MLVISMIPLYGAHGPLISGGPTMLGAWSSWTPGPRSSLLKCSPQSYAGHQGCCHPFRLYKSVDNRSPLLLKPWVSFFSQSQFAHLIVALHAHLLLNKESSRTWAISLTCRRGENTERTLHKGIWIMGLQSMIKPRQHKVYFITSFVTSTESDTVLTLLETGNEGEQ